MSSIDNYLTDLSRPYYNQIVAITNDLTDKIIQILARDAHYMRKERKIINVHIYGGCIRDLISHYYSDQSTFKAPKDVDIWINFNHQFGQTTWYRLLNSIGLVPINYHMNHDEDYCVFKTNIDGIDFDICTKINGMSTFEKLSDFTVNNLYTSIDNNTLHLKSRSDCCSVDDCINHIRDKQLVEIFDENFVKNIKAYHTRLITRRQKMTSNHGYRYVNNVY